MEKGKGFEKALPGEEPTVPLVQGQPIGQRAVNIDAVPLIDAATAQILGQVNSFTIVQRPSFTEALCPSFERSNIYDVFDAASGAHLFYAKERSDCGPRICCSPQHALFVEFKLATGVHPMAAMDVDIDQLPTVMTMEREGCSCTPAFCKPGLGCCALMNVCKDGMFLHAGPLHSGPDDPLKPGQTRTAGPRCVGYATQPKYGGGWSPTINVMERGRGENAWNSLAKLEGPTVFGGCIELCRSSPFTVSAMGPHQLEVPIKAKVGDKGNIALLVKRKPTDMAGALREMVTDADVYSLDINPQAGLAPQQKATMLASLLLADYMYFEKDTAMCDGNGCNLCVVHCCGCLCPCSVGGGGGRPGQQGGMGGGGFGADM